MRIFRSVATVLDPAVLCGLGRCIPDHRRLLDRRQLQAGQRRHWRVEHSRGVQPASNFLERVVGMTSARPALPDGVLVTQATGSLSSSRGTDGHDPRLLVRRSRQHQLPEPLTCLLVAFQTVGGPTFTLTLGCRPAWPEQLDAVAARSGRPLHGGYTDTAASFVFTGNGAGGTFSFSSSQAGARFRNRRRWPCSVADFWSSPPSSAVVVAPARPDKHRDHTRIRRDERPAGLVSPGFKSPTTQRSSPPRHACRSIMLASKPDAR